MTEMDYDPKGAKPHFDRDAYVRDMAKLGGNWAFAGMVTMFRQPHTHDIDGADVVFLGLPWDGTAMTRSGQRYGPRAIRDESTYVLEEMDYTLFDRIRFVDYGDAFFHNGNMFDFLDQAEKTVATILASGASLLAAGGDHLIPLPIVRAFAKRLGRPLALVHLDAHQDNWDVMPYSWGGSWAQELVDEGCVDPARSVQLGIRTPEVPLYPAGETGTVITAEECIDEGPLAAAAKVKEIVGDEPVYLTFDADFLDASAAPACHSPSFCGPDMYWTMKFFRAVAGLNVIGADVNELCPQYEPAGGPTQLALTTVAFWETQLLAAARGRLTW